MTSPIDRIQALGNIEKDIASVLQYGRQAHEGSSYNSQKILQMTWHRLEHIRSEVNELEKLKNNQRIFRQPQSQQQQPPQSQSQQQNQTQTNSQQQVQISSQQSQSQQQSYQHSQSPYPVQQQNHQQPPS
ncbi:Mediator of RNA polymerase II transcription subunit 11 [Armadillidium nasatum]|uniref:Mediator of RNA polymerase II transcription subunit 11 n=1 Tax=Armadillidium nasatum TaxID=96803 RepID=A0A5N5TKN3_9CRUS|nr:Mediator of RNA polymerase II transcription subunit 11 [Armadillidium nasatum]